MLRVRDAREDDWRRDFTMLLAIVRLEIKTVSNPIKLEVM